MSQNPAPPALSARVFAAELWHRLLKRKYGGMIASRQSVSTAEALETLRVVHSVLSDAPDAGLQLEHVHDIASTIDLMGQNLADDVSSLVECAPFYLSFMPLTTGNAYCTQETDLGRSLDMPLIVLHHGLLYASLRLSDCIVIENLTDDLQDYKKDASHCFLQAARSYRRRAISGLLRDSVSNDPAIDTAIAARGGAIASRLLMFIAWHELGHIKNGDLIRVTLTDDETSAHAREQRSREREQRADAFAMQALLSSSSSLAHAWRNAAPVYLFFRWLQAICEVDASVHDPSHPDPGSRADALRTFLDEHALAGEPEHFDWIDSRIPHWSQKLPATLSEEGRHA